MIRRATLADIPWMLETAARAQAEAPNFSRLTSRPGEQYKRFVALMQCPQLIYIGVCADQTGCVIGALEPTVWFQECIASVNIIWVTPEKRGTSRAWRLMSAFEDWALAAGADLLMAEVSSGINDHLVGSFYKGLGYRPLGQTYCKEL